MPLFEYECRGCHQRFEFLTREGRSPACPACRSEDLQKLMSVFAAQSSTPAKSFADRPMSAGSGACGACGDPRGPGACSLN
jgi:putative FmdB family regulatory protein